MAESIPSLSNLNTTSQLLIINLSCGERCIFRDYRAIYKFNIWYLNYLVITGHLVHRWGILSMILEIIYIKKSRLQLMAVKADGLMDYKIYIFRWNQSHIQFCVKLSPELWWFLWKSNSKLQRSLRHLRLRQRRDGRTLIRILSLLGRNVHRANRRMHSRGHWSFARPKITGANNDWRLRRIRSTAILYID